MSVLSPSNMRVDAGPGSTARLDVVVRHAQAVALVALPALLMLVFVLHFRSLADFLDFHWRYEPLPAQTEFTRFQSIAQAHVPVLHDPHMMAYLGLPLFLVCACALHAMARRHRPLLSLAGFVLSCIGVIYLGGLFGMWTAFVAIGQVEPQHAAGASAALEVLITPRGAFLITTTLSRVALVGLLVQALALWGVDKVPRAAVLALAAGYALILVFTDLDNWMLIGSVLILAGSVPIAKRLREIG
jgi:hypothetical protein